MLLLVISIINWIFFFFFFFVFHIDILKISYRENEFMSENLIVFVYLEVNFPAHLDRGELNSRLF